MKLIYKCKHCSDGPCILAVQLKDEVYKPVECPLEDYRVAKWYPIKGVKAKSMVDRKVEASKGGDK